MNAAEEQLVDYLLQDKDFTYIMNNCLPKEIKVAMVNLSNVSSPKELAYKIVSSFLPISSAYYRKTFLIDYANDYPTTDDNLEKMKNVIVNNLFLVVCLDRLVQSMKTSPIEGYTINKNTRPIYDPFPAATSMHFYNPAKTKTVTVTIGYDNRTAVPVYRVSDLKDTILSVDLVTGGRFVESAKCSLGDLKPVLEHYLKKL